MKYISLILHNRECDKAVCTLDTSNLLTIVLLNYDTVGKSGVPGQCKYFIVQLNRLAQPKLTFLTTILTGIQNPLRTIKLF